MALRDVRFLVAIDFGTTFSERYILGIFCIRKKPDEELDDPEEQCSRLVEYLNYLTQMIKETFEKRRPIIKFPEQVVPVS
ncbi:8090_t:CDS:2 [Funneliformis caledonium]|uniref:8090_t:CDS:1 n=1 Tax=Funneliformis caledonium TaxID=1117310 RepID=A0A9N8ZX58_9GLOM|nr:8090_t:CDS:2 [Funneliformis caledonium]